LPSEQLIEHCELNILGRQEHAQPGFLLLHLCTGLVRKQIWTPTITHRHSLTRPGTNMHMGRIASCCFVCDSLGHRACSSLETALAEQR
jgi:hypothetical protein